MRTGLTEADAEELFQKCSAFAEFGFARAHAAAFAKITYDTAWLKRYYPAHYTAGVLNNQPMGFYSPAVVVNDAKRHGIAVLPVDVNESAWEHDTRPVAASSVPPAAKSSNACSVTRMMWCFTNSAPSRAPSSGCFSAHSHSTTAQPSKSLAAILEKIAPKSTWPSPGERNRPARFTQLWKPP